MIHEVDNEDSNQTARMRRLIWVFVGRMVNGMFSHVGHMYRGMLIKVTVSYSRQAAYLPDWKDNDSPDQSFSKGPDTV